MKTNRGIIYIFAIVLVVLSACTSSRTGGTIQDKGKQIEITTKDHSVKALKMASGKGHLRPLYSQSGLLP